MNLSTDTAPANKSRRPSVADRVVRFVKHFGAERIYGCPGTSELSLVHSAARFRVPYQVVLHDTVAVGMADGFARASGRFGVVNLHATQGLLNASGFIRVALRDRVPILIIAGLPATTYDIHEPNHFLPNLQQSLTPIAKWVWTVVNPTVLERALIRAVHYAYSPPQGPVVICIPQDVLEMRTTDSFKSLKLPDRIFPIPAVPPGEQLSVVAKHLAASKYPVLFVGHGAQDAVDEVEQLAALIGAPVIAESMNRGTQLHNVYCRTNFPLFAGYFDERDSLIERCLRRADTVFFVGGRCTYPRILGKLPDRASVIHLSPEQEMIGKDHDPAFPLVGDVATALRAISAAFHDYIDNARLTSKVQTRIKRIGTYLKTVPAQRLARMKSVRLSGTPISGSQLAKALAEELPRDSIIVDDSQCFGHYIKMFCEFRQSRMLYGSLAGHIGWGLPSALGVKQARPHATVVSLVGDGSLMFGLQALAAATSHSIPVAVVVINNHGEVSLQTELALRFLENQDTLGGFELMRPSFDYAQLAKSFGCGARRVFRAHDLKPGIREAIQSIARGLPFLLAVEMSSDWEDWAEAWYIPKSPRIVSKPMRNDRI